MNTPFLRSAEQADFANLPVPNICEFAQAESICSGVDDGSERSTEPSPETQEVYKTLVPAAKLGNQYRVSTNGFLK